MPQISSGNATIDARLNQLLAEGMSFFLFSLPFKLTLRFDGPVTVTTRGTWTVFEGVAQLSHPFMLQIAVKLAIDGAGRYELRFTLPLLDTVLRTEVLPRLPTSVRTIYDRLVQPYVPAYHDCAVILASSVGDDPTLGGILAGINFYVDVALAEIEPTRSLSRAFPAAKLGERRFVLHLGCIASPAFTFVVEGNFVLDAALGTSAVVLDKLVLRTDQDSSSLTASAAAFVTLRMGGETLRFIGALGIDDKGTTMISGSLDAVDGAWKDPFGARGVTITGFGVQVMAAATAPYVGLGLRGGILFGATQASAKLALLYDPSSPDKTVLQIESHNPLDLQTMLGGLVDPQYLPANLFNVAIDDFLIYISPNGGVIAGQEYAPGFALRGAVDLWGLRANVDGMLTYAGGGYLRGAMSPLRYPADGLLVDIHGDPERGPAIDLDFNAARRGGRAVGAVKIVGLYNHTFEAIVDARRLFLALGKTQLGIYSGGTLEVVGNRVTVGGQLSFSADLDVLLGPTRVRFTADVAADYRGSADPAGLSQRVVFAFDACGARLDFSANAGSLKFTDVDSMRKFLQAQSNQIAQELLEALRGGTLAAITWLKGLVPDTTTAAMVLQQAGAAASKAADGLRQAYAASAEQCASALRVAHYPPQAIAAALKSVYSLSEQDVGELLKSIGMSANDIARALHGAFDWSAKKTANFFHDTLDIGDQTTKKALEAADYSSSQIKGAMEDAYGWSESMWDSFVGLFG
jgi:hypothetical protein